MLVEVSLPSSLRKPGVSRTTLWLIWHLVCSAAAPGVMLLRVIFQGDINELAAAHTALSRSHHGAPKTQGTWRNVKPLKAEAWNLQDSISLKWLQMLRAPVLPSHAPCSFSACNNRSLSMDLSLHLQPFLLFLSPDCPTQRLPITPNFLLLTNISCVKIALNQISFFFFFWPVPPGWENTDWRQTFGFCSWRLKKKTTPIWALWKLCNLDLDLLSWDHLWWPGLQRNQRSVFPSYLQTVTESRVVSCYLQRSESGTASGCNTDLRCSQCCHHSVSLSLVLVPLRELGSSATRCAPAPCFPPTLPRSSLSEAPALFSWLQTSTQLLSPWWMILCHLFLKAF